MKLFNKTIDRQLFKQYSLGSDLSKQEVVAKIFNPTGAGTWFILNSDPEDPDYLWAIVDLGYGAEVGSVSRSELENYRGRFGLGFERDLGFEPMNALELYNGLRQGEYYADGGEMKGKDTWQNIFEEFGFKKGKKKYGLDLYYKRGYVGSVDKELRKVDLMFEEDVLYSGYSVQGLLSELENQFGKRNFADGGQIEVVYERRADFKKKPIKLLLLSRGKEQKGYTFSGKDQVAVLENYNRNKQEDLEKLWNLKGYETKYADGGSLDNYDVVIDGDWDEPKKFRTFSLAKKWIYQNVKNYESLELVDPYGDTIFVEGNSTKEDLDWLFSNDEVSAFAKGGNIANFSDNQLMIMNQNVEVEHHHEELEDILEDEVPVPAWVVAKMETATQNLSDITHYLDGQKEIAEDQLEEEDDDDDDDEMETEDIENKEVVEPIVVTAGDKTEITKNFTDDAFGNLKGFLKGMEGIDLRDDYTFDYKDEQYEVEPIINSDENGVSNAVFTIFNGDGEEVGEIAYSREGGKQKFTANSEFFSWNNAKFEDGGYFDGAIPNVSTYMSTYADGGTVAQEYYDVFVSLKSGFDLYKTNGNEEEDVFIGNFKTIEEAEKKGKELRLEKKPIWLRYAKGGEIAKAEILGLTKNILGTTSIEMKISGMRKPQEFSVYPIGKDDTEKIITIQSDTRIGKIDLSSGRGLMSQSHSNGAYFVHFQMDKLTPFTLSESDLEDLKMHIFKTAGDNVGSRGIVSDNSGASRLFADGGGLYELLEYALLEENGNEKYIDNLPNYPEVLTVAFNKNGGHKIYKVYETTLNNGKFVKYPTYRIGRDMKPYSKLKYVLKALDKKVYDENFDNDNYAKGGQIPEWLFVGVYPNAYIYADKRIENKGYYHEIGRIVFNPFQVRIFDNSSKYSSVIKMINKEAEELEKQGVVEISSTGQTTEIKKMSDGGWLDKYQVDRFKQVMNGKPIAKYIVRLQDSFGNKETYVFGIKLNDQFRGCELVPYENLYGGWSNSGTAFSLDNLQVERLVPYSFTNIELEEEETEMLVNKLVNNNQAGVEKFLNSQFFYLNYNQTFKDVLRGHFARSVVKVVSIEFEIAQKFADGGKIEKGQEVGLKFDSEYHKDRNEVFVVEKIENGNYHLKGKKNGYRYSVPKERIIVYRFADGGFMSDVYAKGGSVKKDWWQTVVNPNEDFNNYDDKKPIDWEVDDFKSWVVSNSDLDGNVDKEVLDVVKMPKSKLTVEYLNKNGSGKNNNEYYKEFGNWQSALYDIFTQMKKDYLSKSSSSKESKYILKADIKTVTVKRNGKEVTYKGSDVLNGAHVLAKGGDITSKANYVAKRDVVEVELKDGSKVKPANGYWIKKGAEPISNEPTPTASGKYNAVAFDGKKQIANLSDNEYSDKIESFIKDNEKKGFEVIVDLMNKGKVEQQVYKTSFNKSNETKFGETYIKKDMRNNWKAETTLDDFNDYDWKISTIKTYSGNLVSSAQGGKTEPTGSKGIQMWKYTMYQDPNYTLEVSKPSRLTEKLVSEQHEKALAKFKKFMETGTFKGGGKISKFDKLSAKVAKQYEGKPVKSQYQEEYGKYYSKEEAQEVGDKVAGKMKAMTADKKENGGRISMKLANELAKEIRKDGESWNDAKKRAFAQLKK